MGKILYTDSTWLIDQGRPLWQNHPQPEGIEAIAAWLDMMLQRLPPKYATCVELRFYGRLTYAQIARHFGWFDRHGQPARDYAFVYTQRGLALLQNEMELEGIGNEVLRNFDG